MANSSQLILAALAFLILYVLMHIRRESFLMHWLNGMGSASKVRRAARKLGKRRRVRRR